MDASLFLMLATFSAVLYALAFLASWVLVTALAKPWRRAANAHWTERACLAFAPGVAIVWFAALFPPLAALLAATGLESLVPRARETGCGFWIFWLAPLAGVLTVRYRWLRELWGARVTLGSWLAGCLVVVFVLAPHLLILVLLLFLLPDAPNLRGAALMSAGVVVITGFAFGGGVRLLRVLKVIRPGPPDLVEMVEQMAWEMKVPGRVRVFELEWAQVNAVAWVLYRAVGFSRPLLDVLSREEVRAVTAHELAHLVEPPWVRAVRVAHMFAYLVVVPLMKYGGAGGMLAGWALIMAIAFAYKRFTRRMEVRADRLENEAISDAPTYMRSLVRIHEANMTPAVMPGSQTHPHLYDRLLAGGVQPDFPKPAAPSRVKPLLAALTTLASTVLLLFLMLALTAAIKQAGTGNASDAEEESQSETSTPVAGPHEER